MIRKTLLVGALAIAAITSSRANLGDTYEQTCAELLRQPDGTMDLSQAEGKASIWVRNETEMVLATFNDPDGRCDYINYRYYGEMSEDVLQSYLRENVGDEKLQAVSENGGRSWYGDHYFAALDPFETKDHVRGWSLKIVTQAHINRWTAANNP